MRFSQVDPKLAHVNSGEALEIAQKAAELDALFYSFHSEQRGLERLCSQADAREAVRTADVAMASPDGPNRWVLAGGCDLDGCGRRLVVAIDEDENVTVTVVTVYA